jgi:hypothetical protein
VPRFSALEMAEPRELSGVKFGPGYAGIAFTRRGFERTKMRAVHFVSLHQAYRPQRCGLLDVADQIAQHGDVRFNHFRPVPGVGPCAVKNVGDAVERMQFLRAVLRIQ